MMALSQETLQHLTDFLKGVQQEAPKLAAKLQNRADRYSAVTGLHLDVRGWLLIHLKDMAMVEEHAEGMKGIDEDLKVERDQREVALTEQLRRSTEQ